MGRNRIYTISRMIRTIFFDFGNVLAFFDHWRTIRRLSAFTDMPEEDLYATLYGKPLEDAYEHGAISTEHYVTEAIRLARLRCTPEQFLNMFRDIFTPNPDVLELIPRLAKSYRLCLASNTNDAHFRHYCEQYRATLAHFAALPTSHQAGHRKPAAGFFAYCQQFAEAPPQACAFVDDIAGNVEAARRHGWLGIHYTPELKLADVLRRSGIDY